MLAAQMGRALPPGIDDEPELLTGLEFYLEAFYCLDTERTYITYMPAPIPHSAIKRYGRSRQLRGDELMYFQELLRKLDDWHIENAAKKLEQIGKPKVNQAGSKFGPGKGRAGG